MKVLARVSLVSALLALTSYISSVNADLGNGVKLYGINYDRRQGPDWDPLQCKDANQVWADMKLLSTISNSVRVYGLDETVRCQTSHVLEAAKNYGMKVAMGIWPGTNMPNELRKLENLLKGGHIDGNVMGLHVGSEAIYRKDYSADVAISYLNQVRSLLNQYGQSSIKLTIADVVDSYYQNPQLLAAVDYVSINQFSLWEKKDVNEAMAIMLDRIRSIRVKAAEVGKDVVISETGWASGGTDSRTGVTSIANQKKYFQDFYHQANAHALPYYWFAAIDLSWILSPDIKDMSSVEAYFGVFDSASNLKASFSNLDLNQRSIVTLQSAKGSYLGETYNPNKIEEVAGVEVIAASSDPFTQQRYQWFFDSAKGVLRSVNSDRCLDAYEAWNGGTVHTYMCVDSEKNQKWSYDSSTKQLKHATYTGFCLDSDPAQNGKLQLWGCSTVNTNQQWTVSSNTESKAVRFFAKESTDFLQLTRSGEEIAAAPGALGAANSEWLYDEASKTLQSKDSNYCLDGYEGWAGGRVHVWACNAQEKNQRWTFDTTTGQLKHATHSGLCLDRDVGNGQKLQLWGCHLNNYNQVWRKVSASASAVTIANKNGLVAEFVTRDTLQFSPPGKRDAQYWFYNPFSNTIVSKWGGECLDADQASNNALVHTWDCIASEGNQKWKLESGLIKHQKHTGMCLAVKSSSDLALVLKTCASSDETQSFTMPAASS